MSSQDGLDKGDSERKDNAANEKTAGKEASDHGDENADDEDMPLTITVTSFDDETADDKTPAEKVRLILANQQESEEARDDVALNTHALFCQMDVLCHFDDGDTAWKEASRWLKYEEKVEDGDRWSKPHVSTTSLHALFEIRKGIAEKRTSVQLDVSPPHGGIYEVADLIAKKLATDRGLAEEIADEIQDVLTRPHKHKHRGKAGRKTSVASGLSGEGDPMLTHDPNRRTSYDAGQRRERRKSHDAGRRKSEVGLEHSVSHPSYPHGLTPDDLTTYHPNKRMMKKIPKASEVVNILVGQVDFVEEPITAFVRLSQPAVLADMTEVAFPTRFILVVLGPTSKGSIFEYMEIGRAFGALFTDKVFCEVAYKSQTPLDLLAGIDEFIDDLTVLPPSVWDPSTRLEPPETIMSDDQIRKRLKVDERHKLEPEVTLHEESSEDDQALSRTGRFCGGLIRDMKRRYRLYPSDIKDGLNVQCIASICFLYFACITPIVTFGGLLGIATDNVMGTMECILSGAICGLCFALFAGQPLIIVGATGPLLVFESILYHFSIDHHFDFLSFRFWIGMWIVLILLVMVVFDLSALVRYITRFTEECFAVLISVIFIYEAFYKVKGIWKTDPIHIGSKDQDPDYKCFCVPHAEQNVSESNVTVETNRTFWQGEFNQNFSFDPNASLPIEEPPFYLSNWTDILPEDCITYLERIVVKSGCVSHSECEERGWMVAGPACDDHNVTDASGDVFLLSCFLFLGTFGIAYTLRTFRNSPFFPSIVRSTVADFAVFLSVIICTSIDYAFGVATPKLTVPEKFQTTIADRGWMVNPMNVSPWWLILAGIVPAVLATILIFLDQQISAVIVNRKEHKLKKPAGYHLDLLILAITLGVCSVMGLPWFVAATVRSVTHVGSLKKATETTAPGEKSTFLGVREQRVTGFFIHVLIGVSVLITVVLKNIPMPVLYGVFLYMGITSLGGVQFIDRILILIMPVKYQPDYVYLRHVRTWKVHVFTIIQIAAMIAMWVMKSVKSISIAFPMMILALCFIRKGLGYFFTQTELYWLDHILPEEARRMREDAAKQQQMTNDIGVDVETMDTLKEDRV